MEGMGLCRGYCKGNRPCYSCPYGKVKGEVFNIGTGRPFSVSEIAEKITLEFGIEKNFDFMPDRFGQIQKHISSVEKAEKTFDFKTSMAFEEGLKKTIQWYKENRLLWEKQLPLRRVPVKAQDGSIIWY
ncbi:MAG: hypothetical protein L0922_05750 [Candidatus Mariimomonas ferrooxydans]